MKVNLYKRVTTAVVFSLATCATAFPGSVLAEADWSIFTMDNDALVGTDNGYTNGIYYSWLDSSAINNKPEMGWLAKSMRWSLPGGSTPQVTASVKTIGQTMMTPDDIEIKDPPEGDLPYAGLLFYSDSYVEAHKGYADKISATIGVIGEYSFAEETQKFVHDVISSDEPKGWDTQLDDEIVFQFGRGRVWQYWKSASGSQDLLLGADAALGTISSYAGVSAMWRYGYQLDRTFATALLASGRTSNPVAVDTGWYWFAGISPRYTANMIFLDGNTYDDDSRKVDDWDHEQVAVSLGFAYSWKELSFTYAINDLNVIGDDDNDAVDEYSQYGTFTIAWKHD